MSEPTPKSLIDLRKKANKLNVDFKMETTEEQLAPLVAAAEEKVKEEKEAADKLAKLRRAAAKLGVQYTEENTADEIADLIKQAEAQGADTKATGYEVYNAQGTYIRTYTPELHGEQAKAKANEYAGKISGTVKKV